MTSFNRKIKIIDSFIVGTSDVQRLGGLVFTSDLNSTVDVFRHRAGKIWNTGILPEAQKNYKFLKKDFNYRSIGSQTGPRTPFQKLEILNERNINQEGSLTDVYEADIRVEVNLRWFKIKENVSRNIANALDNPITANLEDLYTGFESPLQRTTAYINFLDYFNGSDFDNNTMFPEIPGFGRTKVFADHVTELTTPILQDELDRTGSNLKGSYFNFEPVYNYYIQEYESFSNSPANKGSDTPESILPNIYAATITKNINDEEINPYLYHVNLNGILESGLVRNIRDDEFSYFDEFSYQIRNGRALEREGVLDIASKWEKIVFDVSTLNNGETGNQKFFYPMYCNISFSKNLNRNIVDYFEENKMYERAFRALPRYDEGELSDKAQEASFSIDVDVDSSDYSYSPFDTIADNVNIKVLDMGDFLDSISELDFNFTQLFDTTSTIQPIENGPRVSQDIINPPDSIMLDSNPKNDGYNRAAEKINTIILASRLRDLANEKVRSYKECLSGKLAFSEVFCYQLDKIARDSGERVQSFYIPNSTQGEIVELIDTQLKYDKDYLYRLEAFVVVIGTQYYYTTPSARPDGDIAIFETTVRYAPSVKILRVPFLEQRFKIMDLPPVFPDIEFFPVKDRQIVKFVIKSGIGDFKQEPVPITQADSLFFEQEKLVQQNFPRNPENLIRFSSDDPPNFYQIFLLNREPSSYKDFAQGIIRNLRTEIGGKKVDSLTAEIRLATNQDYYFVFRAVDVHSNLSNPTPVYKVTLYENDGAIVPKIVEFIFNENRGLEKRKNLRRFLKIEPAFEQILIKNSQFENTTSARLVDSVVLGSREETIYDREFRIVLTSKKTGKKVSFKFKCEVDNSNLRRNIENLRNNLFAFIEE